MSNWLRYFDRVSFWLGFLAATLFWWLLGRFRPLFVRLFEHLKAQAEAARQERSTGDEIRLGNDVLRLAQGWHLTAPLFSLDEIGIRSSLLAPAVPPMAYEPPASDDITDWALPYIPDEPELASFYGAPTLGLAEALHDGANLVIIGQPGAGKSFALAQLACQVVRKSPSTEHLAGVVPVLVHVANLDLAPSGAQAPDEALLSAISAFTSSIRPKKLPVVLRGLLKQGRLLLLLDGLDELSPLELDLAKDYLKRLFEQHPKLRLVVTAHPGNLDGLTTLRLQVVALSSWGQAQRSDFISRWSALWQRYIAASSQDKSPVDPLVLVGWLLNNTARLSPLELTLRVWAAFAGDSLGPSPLAAIEAYLRRMTADQPTKNLAGLGQLAAQMVLAQRPVIERKNAENWLGGAETLQQASIPETTPETASVTAEKTRVEQVRARGALPDLLSCGLLVARAGERLSLSHPGIAAYLVGQVLAPIHAAVQLLAQPEWWGKSASLAYLATLDAEASWVVQSFSKSEIDDPFQLSLLDAGHWLKHAPDGLPWISQLMRELALCLQEERLPLSIKGRALSALVLSNNPGVAVLLRQMLVAGQPVQRQLAALGLGYLRDAKSITELSKLVGDHSPGVSRATLLALVAIGDQSGMETVAYSLLHGDETLRRAAAQALTNDTEEGYPTLQEGSALEDPGVRRAVTYGLGRLRLPWATEILEKMVAEDSQWVVQDAANQMLHTIQNPHPRLPRSLPPLTQTAWLIAFAAERGMGIAPGKPAVEMLFKALREGDEDQKLAVLYYLGQSGEESAVLPIYQVYFVSQGELREAAFSALWNLAACGIQLPPPAQYGLVPA
jgi:HEAT repeat protein